MLKKLRELMKTLKSQIFCILMILPLKCWGLNSYFHKISGHFVLLRKYDINNCTFFFHFLIIWICFWSMKVCKTFFENFASHRNNRNISRDKLQVYKILLPTWGRIIKIEDVEMILHKCKTIIHKLIIYITRIWIKSKWYYVIN